MKIKTAIQQSIKKSGLVLTINDCEFHAVGWVSPSTGQISGPYFCQMFGNRAIEVDSQGRFLDSIHEKADFYIVWIPN